MSKRPGDLDAAIAPHIDALVVGKHGDPFSVLGPHQVADKRVVRVLVPGADKIEILKPAGPGETQTTKLPMTMIHKAGLFEGEAGEGPYRLCGHAGGNSWEFEDPYRFGRWFGEMDEYFLAEGSHGRLWEKLGAHLITFDGVDGCHFAVWAPNASSAAVVGDFNYWNGLAHPMRKHPGSGIFEIFIPGVGAKSAYKFQLHDGHGNLLPLKSDPMGFAAEYRPKTASVVADLNAYQMQHPRIGSGADRPMSIIEVHAGSWKRHADDSYLSYDEMADDLIAYAVDMGFTHIEFLPISEHPFDGSWGYQPVGLFAPTSRFGPPDAFKRLVDAAHAAGIGIILDWVPAHFPTDEHGLAKFDGTSLYEHQDSRQGYHPDWNTLIYNLGRTEVVNYLIANAVFWLEEYRIDGLRVDAVASMLYLDYSREEGEWIPNKYGGNENLESIAFLRKLNETLFERFPDCLMIAEESTSWPGVSRPTYTGGLGFGYKWNMGWMHDTLNYVAQDPVHRRWHHHEMTFALLYAFSENFVLPISHDEVVHGKGTVLSRMPGDDWQKFANLRAYYGFMWGHPGKKLLFMGQEFAQRDEWNAEQSLDWHVLEHGTHQGVKSLVRDLNKLMQARPALYRLDCDAGGFEWLEANDAERSIYAWIRHGDHQQMLVICNLTPVPRKDFRLGLPRPGRWVEKLNTDAEIYGGSGLGNMGAVASENVESHGKPCSALFTLPPLATLYFEPAE